MAEVYIFENGGKIRLASLINPLDRVCRANFKDVKACPKEVLDFVPEDIVALCKEIAPIYLYLNPQLLWETATEPTPV